MLYFSSFRFHSSSFFTPSNSNKLLFAETPSYFSSVVSRLKFRCGEGWLGRNFLPSDWMQCDDPQIGWMATSQRTTLQRKPIFSASWSKTTPKQTQKIIKFVVFLFPILLRPRTVPYQYRICLWNLFNFFPFIFRSAFGMYSGNKWASSVRLSVLYSFRFSTLRTVGDFLQLIIKNS